MHNNYFDWLTVGLSLSAIWLIFPLGTNKSNFSRYISSFLGINHTALIRWYVLQVKLGYVQIITFPSMVNVRTQNTVNGIRVIWPLQLNMLNTQVSESGWWLANQQTIHLTVIPIHTAIYKDNHNLYLIHSQHSYREGQHRSIEARTPIHIANYPEAACPNPNRSCKKFWNLSKTCVSSMLH